jgi:prophage regulatory protein
METNAKELPSGLPGGYIRLANLLNLVPVGRSTLWQWVRDQKFPAPVKLSERITAWRVEDVRSWLAAQGQKEAA